MTNRVEPTIIMDGPTQATIHYYLESDGVVGELDRRVILDPQVDFAVPVAKVSIMKVWHSFAVFDGVLEFNALEPYPVWVLSADASGHECFEYFGGLKDRSTAASDGKLMLSTSGFTPAGSKGVLILQVKKN